MLEFEWALLGLASFIEKGHFGVPLSRLSSFAVFLRIETEASQHYLQGC